MDIYKGAEELTTPVRDRQLARKVTGLGKKTIHEKQFT